MLALCGTQIHADLVLEIGVDPVQEVLQQHILRWDCGIRFEFEHPMPVRPLPAQQRRPRAFHGTAQRFVAQIGRRYCIGHSLKSMSAARRPDRIAPSIVAGKPVAVQSPARNSFAYCVRVLGRRAS